MPSGRALLLRAARRVRGAPVRAAPMPPARLRAVRAPVLSVPAVPCPRPVGQARTALRALLYLRAVPALRRARMAGVMLPPRSMRLRPIEQRRRGIAMPAIVRNPAWPEALQAAGGLRPVLVLSGVATHPVRMLWRVRRARTARLIVAPFAARTRRPRLAPPLPILLMVLAARLVTFPPTRRASSMCLTYQPMREPGRVLAP